MTGYIAIFGWPAAVAAFFARFGLSAAVCVTVIYGYLLLPQRPVIDLPILPALDKNSIPALTALLFVIVGAQNLSSGGRPQVIPKGGFLRFMLVGFLVCGLMTAILNTDALRYGATFLAGMTVYDGMSAGLSALILLIPFTIGYSCLAHPKDHRVILIVLAFAGAFYSVLGIYEMVMSPQLNLSIYGFFPHEWLQHRRGAGWRPIIFLEHGLFVASFLSMAAVAAIGIFRGEKGSAKTKGLWLAGFTGATLLLSGNLGASLILLTCGSVLLFTSPRMQMWVAAAFALLVLLYPIARGANVIPIGTVLSAANSFDEARAQSLEFRLDNEEELLEKARERPLFGWGGWARGRIYNDAGRMVSVTDGYWIIIFGDGGLVRYLFEMGLLTLPSFCWHGARRR